MNPVTRRLLDRIDDPDLAELALAWDAFEECIVAVVREEPAVSCTPQELLRRRKAALRTYGRWSAALGPHWRATPIDGAAVAENPFEAVIRATSSGVRAGDRDLLRTLPAAREALNALLLERAAA